MTMTAMNRVWDTSATIGTNRVVLLALADRADDKGIAYPSIDWIAQRANIRPRQVRNILRSLEECGELITIPGRGRGNTNLYIVATGLSQTELVTLLAIYGVPSTPPENRQSDADKTGNLARENRQSKVENRQSDVDKTGNLTRENRQSDAQNRQSSVIKPAIAVAADPNDPMIPNNLTAVAATAAAPIPQPSDRNRQTDPEFGAICTAYENEIGLLTETIGQELKTLADEYPPPWIIEALSECARANVRRLNYAKSILTRWKNEGRKNDNRNRPDHRRPSPAQPAPVPDSANVYNQLLGWSTA